MVKSADCLQHVAEDLTGKQLIPLAKLNFGLGANIFAALVLAKPDSYIFTLEDRDVCRRPGFQIYRCSSGKLFCLFQFRMLMCLLLRLNCRIHYAKACKIGCFHTYWCGPNNGIRRKKMLRSCYVINVQLIWATFTHVGFRSGLISGPLGGLRAPTGEDLWFCFTPER